MAEQKRKARNEYMREYMKQYRKKNPEKIKRIMLNYYRKVAEAEKMEA